MKSNHVSKYHVPTKFDIYPYATIWSVIGDESIIDRYIQLSEQEDCPNWENLGSFLEKCLLVHLDNQEFISMCLTAYKKTLLKD